MTDAQREYHRTYMARRRAEERAGRPPTIRERVLAALTEEPKTICQIVRALGDGYERPTVYYHLRRLVRAGLADVVQSERRYRDDALTGYRLVGPMLP